MIARAIEARAAAFTLGDALTLPAVRRGIDIITSHGATFTPVAYRDGTAMGDQPRIVTRPDNEVTRYGFVWQTLHAMVTAGDGYWLVGDADAERYPQFATVLPPAEVGTQWDGRRRGRTFTYRGEDFPAYDSLHRRDPSILHVPLGRPAGELEGRSPIEAALNRLAVIAAAEEFAAAYFAAGGLPEVVLKSLPRLDKAEAELLRDQYINSGAGADGRMGPRPVRVVSGDVSLDFPAADPSKAQLNETRARARTEVAMLLGIPAPMMLIETSGSSINYTNTSGLVMALVRETLGPMYLDPIEQAWSELLPSTQTVKFDLRELVAADVKTRQEIELGYLAAGVLTVPEVRRLEGWPVGTELGAAPAYRPTPLPIPMRLEVPA